MKKIAFYLPQFHAIPENNEWWGEGFTEWDNVKKTSPRFKGHNQPRIPLNSDYYCLLDDETMEKQSKIARTYGIDGFCYYHYWFNGKLLLEQPLKNMLNNKKVDIPFCFSWANESWSRNWDGGNKEILIDQNYGTEIDWEKHFNYLLQFFKDDRYIKINNKPMLIIYKPHLIENCKEMIGCWNQLAINAGFSGLHFGYQHHSCFYNEFPKELFNFGIEFEPWYTIAEIDSELTGENSKLFHMLTNEPKYVVNKFMNKIRKSIYGIPNRYPFQLIANRIIKRPNQDNIMKSCFPDWDNSPRHVKDAEASIFCGCSPEEFEKLCRGLKSTYKNEILFINAWNEWAEGAYLEPDQKNGYGYLNVIKNVFNNEEKEGI